MISTKGINPKLEKVLLLDKCEERMVQEAEEIGVEVTDDVMLLMRKMFSMGMELERRSLR